MMLEIEDMAKPLQNFSHLIVACNIKLFQSGISHPFTVLNDRTKLLTATLSEKIPWLVKTEKALRSFGKMIDKIGGTEGLYFNIREVDRVQSGYITEILVIILNSNQELEYQIYDAFGKLLRTYSPLLFDLHIIKLRGRRLDEVIPEWFWRYE